MKYMKSILVLKTDNTKRQNFKTIDFSSFFDIIKSAKNTRSIFGYGGF